jgi:hypothetical protein
VSVANAAFRERIFQAVVPVLEADPTVRGCWEGGSVAMGRADELSDIDLYVVAELPEHVAILDKFETALRDAATVAHAWRVDPQSYAGITQRIYLLSDAPRFFAVDCAAITAAASVQFLERERHGEARVLFDRDGSITVPPLDRARHDEKMQLRLKQIRGSWPVYRTVVEKELARGRSLDAIGFYFNGLMRPLIELVGMRDRPDRFDYGWRYLHDELSSEVVRQLEALAYVETPERIRANLQVLDRLVDALFSELGAPS